MHVPLVQQRLGTLLCPISVLGTGWTAELTASFHCLSTPLAPVSPRQCSVTCGEGVQLRQVVCRANASSLGQCEGDKPDTVQVCSLPACGGEPGRMGVQPSSSGLDLRPSLAGFPVQILELLFPLTENLQNSTVRADVRELVTPDGEWVPQSGPLDPINKISSSKCISGPHPLPILPVFTASWAWAVQWSGPGFPSVHVTLASWSLGFLSCEVGMMLILVHDPLSAVPKY